MENERESLKAKLDRLIELTENQKAKKFRLPLGARLFAKMKAKKDYVIVQYIKTNGNVVFKMVPIKDNTTMINEVYHEATAGDILRYKGLPLIIQPEWSITPFSPRTHMKETVAEGKLSSAEKYIINRIKMDLVKKTKFNVKAVGILIFILIGAAIILSYFGVI